MQNHFKILTELFDSLAALDALERSASVASANKPSRLIQNGSNCSRNKFGDHPRMDVVMERLLNEERKLRDVRKESVHCYTGSTHRRRTPQIKLVYCNYFKKPGHKKDCQNYWLRKNQMLLNRRKLR